MKPYKSNKWPFRPSKRQQRFMELGIGPPGPDMRLFRSNIRPQPGRGRPGLYMRLYRHHMRPQLVRGPAEPDTRPHRCLIRLQGSPEPDMEPCGSGMGPPEQSIWPPRHPEPDMGPCQIHMQPVSNIGPAGPGVGPPGPSMCPSGQNMGIPGMSGSGIGYPGMPPLPPQVMPQPAMPDFCNQPEQSNIWVEYVLPTGQVYYYDIVTHVSSWTRPDNACIVRQAEFENICNVAQGLIDTGKSTCLSAPPDLTDNTSNDRDKVCNKSQPEKAASDWTQWREHKDPSGRTYYYNICTQKSVWDKPQVLLDFYEKLRMAGVSQTNVQQNADKDTEDSTDESEEEVVEESKKQPEAVEEKVPEQKPEPKTESKPVNKSRPVARIAIPGTVWYLVRTSDGRCFFYDPSKRHSAWERPEELKDRPDVDKLLSHKPEVKTEDKEENDVQEEPPSKKIK